MSIRTSIRRIPTLVIHPMCTHSPLICVINVMFLVTIIIVTIVINPINACHTTLFLYDTTLSFFSDKGTFTAE